MSRFAALNRARDPRTFEIDDIQPGPYELTASTRVPDSPGVRGNSGRTRIDVRSEDLNDVEIRLKAPINLRGRIIVREVHMSSLMPRLSTFHDRRVML
jgi:hypothetical protein